MTECGGMQWSQIVGNGGRLDWKARSTIDCSAWKVEEEPI